MEITWNAIVNCKAGLKLKTTKHCVLAVAGNDNTNGNPNNIIFTIKDTKLYVPVVTLWVKYNQNLSKLLSKGLERSVYWSEYKTKSENGNRCRYFLESNFVGINRLFVLVYSNQDSNSKRFKNSKILLTKSHYWSLLRHHEWKKLSWPTHWFWYKTKK